MSAYRTSASVDGIGIEQRHPHGRIGLAMPPDSLSTPLRLITIFTRLTPELVGRKCPSRPPLVLITTLGFGNPMCPSRQRQLLAIYPSFIRGCGLESPALPLRRWERHPHPCRYR